MEKKMFQKTQEDIEGEVKTERKSSSVEKAFGNFNVLKPVSLKVFLKNYLKIIM